MPDSPPDFNPEIWRLHPLTEKEKKEFIRNVRKELMGEETSVSYRHKQKGVSIIGESAVPDEVLVTVIDRTPPGKGVSIRISGPAVAVETRGTLAPPEEGQEVGDWIEIDLHQDREGEVSHGDIEVVQEFLDHPERFDKVGA